MAVTGKGDAPFVSRLATRQGLVRATPDGALATILNNLLFDADAGGEALRFMAPTLDGGVWFGTPYCGVAPGDVPADSFLKNDLQGGDGRVRGHIAVAPEHGTLVAYENGAFVYTPTSAYEGPDSFTYELFEDCASIGAAVVDILVGNPTGPILIMDAFGR